MKKFKLKYLLYPLIILSIFYFAYLFFQPKEKEIILFDQLNPSWINYQDLIEHLDAEAKAYFFCTETDANCIYTNNEIIETLAQDANTVRFTQIYYVNMSALDSEILPSALKSSLGFSHYPAFALLSKENNTIKIHSVYEWSEDAFFSQYGLKTWMNANGLWLDEYTN